MIKRIHLVAIAFLPLLAGACTTTGLQQTAVQAPRGDMKENEEDLYLSVIEQLVDADKAHAALAHLDEYEQRNGKTPLSRLLRGKASLATGDDDVAATEFAAITSTVLAAQGFNGLGRVAAIKSDWKTARENFIKAVAASPANAELLNNLGFAQLKSKQFDKAEETLLRARELAPNDRLVANNLVLMLALTSTQDRLAELFPDEGRAYEMQPGELDELMAEYTRRQQAEIALANHDP